MRRPEAKRDLSESFWDDFLGYLANELDNGLRASAGFDCEAIDALLLASLNRVSHFLGQYSSNFSSDAGPLMVLTYRLARSVSILSSALIFTHPHPHILRPREERFGSLYPEAVAFASAVLLPEHNRRRIRRDTL